MRSTIISCPLSRDGGTASEGLWIFGYGSLIWNPGFESSHSYVGSLAHWQLRFWQASTDHRGTPSAPGRVATIVPQQGAEVWGRVYFLPGDPKEVLAYLDHREKGGYTRRTFQISLPSGRSVSALCYVGDRRLRAYIGPEEEQKTAHIIARSVGPSGKNLDYLQQLYLALKELKKMEPHVSRLYALTTSLRSSKR